MYSRLIETQIHSLDFTENDLKSLRKTLKVRCGVEARLHAQNKYAKKKWRIYIIGSSAERFRQIISPFMIPMFNYKIEPTRLPK